MLNMYAIASAARWRGVEHTPRWPLRLILTTSRYQNKSNADQGGERKSMQRKHTCSLPPPNPQYSKANKHLQSGVVLDGQVQPSEPLSREMCASSGCELTSSAQLAEQRQSSVKIQFSCRPMCYAGRLQPYHLLFFVSCHPI